MPSHPNDIFLSRKVVEVDGGRIFEVVTEQDGLGYGFARAEENFSREHFHNETLEIYVCVKGKVVAVVEGVEIELTRGKSLEIGRGQKHFLKKGEEVEIHVYTFPAYKTEDVFYTSGEEKNE